MIRDLNQTLAEQLLITDVEIQNRKALLGFDEVDKKILSAHKSFMHKHVDSIVNAFYERQMQSDEVSLIIGDVETLHRVKILMRRFILEMFDGFYNVDYVNHRLRIGKVHQRMGVSTKLYLAGVYILQDLPYQVVDDNLSDISPGYTATSLKSSIHKLTMFDTQLVFDTYFFSLASEVKMAKRELSSYVSSLESIVAERTQQLETLSRTDSLTGLYNQRAFYETLRHELSLAERYQESLSLCYFDLDGFKRLNDSLGHQAGDEVLKTVGRAIAVSMRETDVGCRYGGDEFCIIYPRTTAIEAQNIVERTIKAYLHLSDETQINFSIGIADTGPIEFMDIDGLIHQADSLMYEAKQHTEKKDRFLTMIPSCEVSFSED